MKSFKKPQIGLNVLFIIICAMIVLPFLLVISISISNELDISDFGYLLIPKSLDLSAYAYVFKNPTTIIDAYKITIIFSLITMVLAVILQAMIAYALTKKEVKFRGTISLYLYFTMLFSGGLVPSYILITRYLHIDDTIWVYILPNLIGPWTVFMMRTFFQGIPKEISESAIIDGASEYRLFFQMIIPLSKPVLATVALMTFLGKWNDWFTSMLYVKKNSLISLQYLLQKIMQNIQVAQSMSGTGSTFINAAEIPSETVRMAMAVVAAGPALLVFPFFQKYFVKGITVGSVKG